MCSSRKPKVSRCAAVPNQHQAFSYGAGSNYVFVNIYNEDNATHPLDEGDTGIIDITGSDGQEDVVVQSAASVNLTVGKCPHEHVIPGYPSLHSFYKHRGSVVSRA